MADLTELTQRHTILACLCEASCRSGGHPQAAPCALFLFPWRHFCCWRERWPGSFPRRDRRPHQQLLPAWRRRIPRAISTTSKRSPLPTWKAAATTPKASSTPPTLLEQRYKSLGLEPAGTKGYFQPFSVITGAKLAGNNEVTADAERRQERTEAQRRFCPVQLFFHGRSQRRPSSLRATAPRADEFGYDDYAGIDVKGKIVVLLRYEPAGFAAKSGNQGLTRHAALITKAINARNHGAKAVVIVNGKLGNGEQDSLTRFGSVSGPENAGISLVQVKNSVAQAWFAAAGKSLADVQKQIDTAAQARIFRVSRFTLRLSIDVNIETTAQHRQQCARLSARQNRRIRHPRRALRSSRLRPLRFAGAFADRPDSSRRGRQRLRHRRPAGTRAPAWRR